MDKVILITQARMGSTRLPGKILLKVKDRELLKIHLDRLSTSESISKIIVATTTNELDNVIQDKCDKWGYHAFRGSENDVLDRYYQASKFENPDYIVRVTSDCPLIDSELIDSIVEYTLKTNLDYCSNTLLEEYPDGQDVEVFKFSALEKAWNNAELISEREHVTPYIKNNSTFNGVNVFKSENYSAPENFNHIRMTVDELNDYKLIELLINNLGFDKSWLEYTKFIIKHDLIDINKHITRNEGYLKSIIKDQKSN